jgi:hypothetical protein
MDRTTTPHTNFDTASELGRLAARIADFGIEAVAPAALDTVAHAAAEAGASTVLTALLVDDTAPAVARERAFGRLAAELARPRRATPALIAA